MLENDPDERSGPLSSNLPSKVAPSDPPQVKEEDEPITEEDEDEFEDVAMSGAETPPIPDAYHTATGASNLVSQPIPQDSPPSSPYNPYAGYLAYLDANETPADVAVSEATDPEGTDPRPPPSFNRTEGVVLRFGPGTEPKSAKTKSAAPTVAHITGKDRERRLAVHRLQLICDLAHLRCANRLANDPHIQSLALSALPAPLIDNLTGLNAEAGRFLPARSLAARRAVAVRTVVVKWQQSYGACLAEDLDGLTTTTAVRTRVAERLKVAVSANPDNAHEVWQRQQIGHLAQALADRSCPAEESTVLLVAALRCLGVEARLVRSLHPLSLRFGREELARELRGDAWLGLAECGVPHRRLVEALATAYGPRSRPAAPGSRWGRVYPRTWFLEYRVVGERRWRIADVISGDFGSNSNAIETGVHAPFPDTSPARHAKAKQSKPPTAPRLVPDKRSGSFPVVYAVAIDSDGFWRDVTRRYAARWTTVTHKLRDPDADHVTPDGLTVNRHSWWGRLLRRYERPQTAADSDQVADELEERRAAEAQCVQEPMPHTLAGFKDHPAFALERHLKQTEIIHPREPVIGHIRGEPVYPRSNVHALKTREHWYREGREVVVSAEPLKHVKARRARVTNGADSAQGVEFDVLVRRAMRTGLATTAPGAASRRADSEGRVANDDRLGAPLPETVPLFGIWQTQAYQAPPVVDGKVPRNRFGHVDLFVPSMLPPGGAHIPFSGAATVARMLGIDYAPAVVGFDFSSRRCAPSTRGIVVPKESEAIVVEGLAVREQHDLEKDISKRQARILGLWRKLIVGSSIRSRLKRQYGDWTVQAAPAAITVVSDDEYDGGKKDHGEDDSERDVKPACPNIGGGTVPKPPNMLGDRAPGGFL
ncbi:hypothetical protein IWQ60_009532 [Tieghemiomyces parasiticus]|uniref:Rad4-domain-containing protein n=1 Tax=Tieghemiomyces parasiticus TaxID=78921 RepID=A0A9W7ZNV8_9FUNG|nr:hypothetical protein IWQ60_009532 [Tieghemiomyces parasiticus]